MLSGVSSTVTTPKATARRVSAAVTPPTRVRAARLVAEALAIAAVPVIAYFLLRLRLMPFPDINDPAMHTTYIVDPRDFFERYTDLLTPTARMREGARVGLLVPGRITYLLFGPVGGFVAFRYVLALIAVAPAYLLMRRLSGIAAGLTAAAVVMTCPVILTAWGTDFPDSASVSYLIGALAFLAMPSPRHQVRWAAAGVVLLTLAVWAFASSLVFAGIFAATYLALRRWRARDDLGRDFAIGVGVSVATTVLLVVASGLLLGQFDFIVPTIYSLYYLAHPSQEALWHSISWAWAPYDTYLLVLPVVALGWLATEGHRIRSLPTPHLMLGLGFILALGAAAFLQFIGKVQLLEEHYFSSLSWAAAMLVLSLLLTVAGKPLLDHSVWRWSLPLMVVAVALVYEQLIGRQTTGWSLSGVGLIAAAALLIIVVAAFAQRMAQVRIQRASLLTLLCGFDACLLLITVAPVTPFGPLPGVVPSPVPQFAGALGGGDDRGVDVYRVSAELPGFVGPAAYPGERVLMWWPADEQPDLLEPIGMFHAYFNSISGTFGALAPIGVSNVEQRRPALILLMSTGHEAEFPSCLTSLSQFGGHLVKAGTLSSGSYTLHVWLIRLDRYSR
jgi:hypothetical protein